MSAFEQERLGNPPFDVFAVIEAMANKHPELVSKFLQVTDRATAHLEENPDDAQSVIARAAGLKLEESNIVLSPLDIHQQDRQLTRTPDAGQGLSNRYGSSTPDQ